MPSYKDEELLRRSREHYELLGLPRSLDKAFEKMDSFVAWGTEVCSQPGTAAAPLQKVVDICAVSLDYARRRHVHKGMLRRIVAVQQHPLQHRVLKFIEDFKILIKFSIESTPLIHWKSIWGQ